MTTTRRRRKSAAAATPRSRSAKRPPAPRPPRIAQRLGELGPLRWSLAVLVLAVLVLAPRVGTPAVMEGWRMFPTLIVPTLAPLVFLVLMLDALMARVHMTSVQGEALARYRRIVTVDLLLGLIVVVYWAPYFVALARP